ncbi:MAG: sodium-dependent transporter [bacterium]|nr:sodium-dependent transporter [bacterium]
MSKERFQTKLGFILAGLGMAVGAGNIWRFPRVAAQNGGGPFILTWVIFLFLWSLPLLIIEFGMGRSSRKGLVGAFKEFAGKKLSWMGSFVAFVSTAIMFYYTVVTGWFLKYFIFFAFSSADKTTNTETIWTNFISTQSLSTFWQTPYFFQLMALLVTSVVVYFGIARGIEKANSILIPALFILLLIAAFKVLSLPGFGKGMNFLFDFKWEQLANYKVWLEGLSQSAWSTGAGWGLLLTYSVYVAKKEDPVVSSTVIALGNNSASLLAAIIIVPTIFSFNTAQESMGIMAAGNQGLAFIHLPHLFLQMPGGKILAALFFLALFFAAFSSLISLLELPVRILMDFGMRRKRAIFFVAAAAFLLGLPSALSIDVFDNQDWVWGLALMVSGLFFVIAVIRFGVDRFRREKVNPFSSIKLNRAFNVIVKYVIPIEFVLMLGWWFYQSIGWKGVEVFSIFNKFSPGSTLFQWGIILFVCIMFNKKIVRLLK